MVKRKRLKVRQSAIDIYTCAYPFYTKESVFNVLRTLRKKGIRLSAVTVDYYLRPKRFDGLGMGKMK